MLPLHRDCLPGSQDSHTPWKQATCIILEEEAAGHTWSSNAADDSAEQIPRGHDSNSNSKGTHVVTPPPEVPAQGL